jgi:hypothetical protein
MKGEEVAHPPVEKGHFSKSARSGAPTVVEVQASPDDCVYAVGMKGEEVAHPPWSILTQCNSCEFL